MSEKEWQIHAANFSAQRMGTYLREARFNPHAALALYSFNIELSLAFWENICHVEVAFRNAISNRIRQLHQTNGLDPNWLIGHQHEVLTTNVRMVSAVVEAQTRIIKNKKTVTYEQLISELSLGFWCQFAAKHNKKYWPDISRSFLGASKSQLEMSALLSELRMLRNRIGHHHRIYNLDLEAKHANLLKLASMIDPELGQWLAGKSQVPKLLAQRPTGSNVAAKPQPKTHAPS